MDYLTAVETNALNLQKQLAEHFECGVQHICLCPADYDIEQVERIAAEVLPLAGASVKAA